MFGRSCAFAPQDNVGGRSRGLCGEWNAPRPLLDPTAHRGLESWQHCCSCVKSPRLPIRALVVLEGSRARDPGVAAESCFFLLATLHRCCLRRLATEKQTASLAVVAEWLQSAPQRTITSARGGLWSGTARNKSEEIQV